MNNYTTIHADNKESTNVEGKNEQRIKSFHYLRTQKFRSKGQIDAILDGVLYIRGRSKMHRAITQELTQYNIMSALVLREFLYQL